MKMSFALLALAIAVPTAAEPQRGDQMSVYKARKQGKLLPLPEIERRVVPTMHGAQYLGFDFDPGSAIYTMKFLRNGTVIWVEVDGRTGQVVGRTGR